jgi:hypothetical protein
MKPWAEKLAALVSKSGGEWVTGKNVIQNNHLIFIINNYYLQLTYADFEMASYIRMFCEPRFNFGDIIPAVLQDHCKKVEALPGVHEWIATRPQTYD